MTATEAKPAFTLDASQTRFYQDEARVQAVCWHRQKGKDFVAALKAVRGAMTSGDNWFIVSLTQRQADETFDKCVRWAKLYKMVLERQFIAQQRMTETDPWLDQEFNWTAHELNLPNGGKVISLPGRNPDTLAGFTGNIILTEFGLFPNGGYDHWSVLFPIVTRGGYKVIAISTPRGKNTRFYELVSDPETYSVHFCDIYRSVYEEGYQLHDGKGKPFPQSTREQQEAAIAGFRRLYNDEAKWPREYECQFTGDLEALIKFAQLQAAGAAGAAQPFDWLRIDGDNFAAVGFSPKWFERDDTKPGRLEIGWDVARTGHLSSVWCNHAEPGRAKRLRFLVLMHRTSFALQREVIRAAMKAGGRANVGAGDATGMGMDSNETLQAEFGVQRWLPFSFGGKGKAELGSIGATAFDAGGQVIPPMDGPAGFIAADLASIQADRTGGVLRLDEGQNPMLPESHCDIAYSCLLALKAGGMSAVTPYVGWL